MATAEANTRPIATECQNRPCMIPISLCPLQCFQLNRRIERTCLERPMHRTPLGMQVVCFMANLCV